MQTLNIGSKIPIGKFSDTKITKEFVIQNIKYFKWFSENVKGIYLSDEIYEIINNNSKEKS